MYRHQSTFLAIFAAAILTTGGAGLLPNSDPPVNVSVALALLALAGIPLSILATHVVLLRVTPLHVGSVRQFGDSRPFRAWRWAMGHRLAPCGCLYAHTETYRSRTNAPATEELEQVREFWQRTDGGARWKFTKRIEYEVRCTRCGGRYLKDKQSGIHAEVEYVWKDAALARPDDELDIVRE